MKILHVMNSELLIDRHISRFAGSGFENIYIYLSAIDKYKGSHKKEVLFVVPDSLQYQQLLQHINEKKYDIVILYGLNLTKVALLNKIEKGAAAILWSFYGYELYSLHFIRKKMLGDETRKLVNSTQKAWKNEATEWVRDIVILLGGKNSSRRQRLHRFYQSLKKVDYFLWFNASEHKMLNVMVDGRLPPFLQQPLAAQVDAIEPLAHKEQSIIFGNSQSYYNNHLDGLHIIKKAGYVDRVVIPFNYGGEEPVRTILKSAIKQTGLTVDLIEEVLPFPEYIALLNRQSAAVYPSFRQLALGNILLAIRCQVKVYLSEKNATLPWLLGLGFRVFSLEHNLPGDIKLSRLQLTEEEQAANNIALDFVLNNDLRMQFFESLHALCAE